MALIVAGIVLFNVFKGTGSGGETHTIRYEVTGASSASITYQTGSQDSAQQTDASVPWQDTETMGGGDFYYVSAQNSGGGTIVCSVDIDGTQVDTNSSSGQYAICTASGSVG